MVVQVVNVVIRTRLARSVMDSALGVHPDAWTPTQVIDGARGPRHGGDFST